MTGNKTVYDLVCSLGGSCATAHNLQIRNLRPCAYPFDWTYFTEVNSVYKLAESFKNNFSDILLKENLKELSINPEHSDKIQYQDLKTGIVWANHFKDKIENEKEYREVKQKIDRRCKRLLEHIQKANKILFIFSLPFEMEIKVFEDFLAEIKKIYPNKTIDLKIVCFSCKETQNITKNSIELINNKRPINRYDFVRTNFVWAFLDDIALFRTTKDKIRIAVCKFFINLCPFKLLIREMRKIYNVK